MIDKLKKLGVVMNWQEITEFAKEGFKIGLSNWHKDCFWPIDHNGDVVIGEIKKLNPELFLSTNWVILIDNPAYLKNILNDDCYERLEKLNALYREIVKKLEWFVGPGKVARNPSLMENFEYYIIDQLKRIEELNSK